MIVTFLASSVDVDKLIEQLQWIKLLGSNSDYHSFIVCDSDTPFDKVLSAASIARESFKSCEIVSNVESVKGWIEGSKSLFLVASGIAMRNNKPFLLMEADAIPMSAGWVSKIEKEYLGCGRKFMGHIYVTNSSTAHPLMMSGIAVYPPETFSMLGDIIRSGQHWDVTIAPHIITDAINTGLIHHIWGEANNPPVFADRSIPGTSVLSLENISTEAVIFHRSKDHSLVRVLKRKMGIPIELEPMVVVFPVAQDVGLAIAHAEWLEKMGMKHEAKAIITFDSTIDLHHLNRFRQLIRSLFSEVEMFSYPSPPVRAWPNAPNWAFQHVANHMRNRPVKNSWLWMEADACALKPNWVEIVADAYARCGHNFFGPKVAGMAHSNGVMVYPSDAADKLPRAMAATGLAWDYVMAEDMMFDCADASSVLQHIWTIAGDEAIQVGGGEVPCQVTLDRARRWIRPGSAVVHRIKDSTLIELLKRGQFVQT